MKSAILILIIAIQTFAYSNELLDIKKISDNVVLLRFNDRVNYSTNLSNDKKNISIIIQNTTNKTTINNKKINSDILKEVFIQNKNNGLHLNFILKSNSGFNTFQLPYSNSIIVDIFNWEKVNKYEDKYRSGLFAYESSLYNQAIILFDDVKTEIPEAQGMLGLVYLLDDNLEKSFYQLSASAQKKTFIPDVYAALGQIYKEKGKITKASYYENIFFLKLGITDTVFEYPKLIFDKSNIDSLTIEEIIDSNSIQINVDDGNNRFSNLFDKNNSEKTTISNAQKKLETEDAFVEIKDWLKYLIIALLLGGLLLLSLYLKWRKNRLDKQTNLARKSFEKELIEEKRKRQDSQKSIMLDRMDENSNIKVPVKNEITKPNEYISTFKPDSNIVIDNINRKIEAKGILKSIDKHNSSNTNIDLSKIKLDNNELKSKLYSKFNVDRSSNNKS